jgi:hypothetical protein
MSLAKLKTAIGTSIVVLAIGVGSLVYNAELIPGGVRAAEGSKPKSELDSLRKENELLKVNLQVTLEKIQAQEAELVKLRGQVAKVNSPIGWKVDRLGLTDQRAIELVNDLSLTIELASKLALSPEIESAIKA